MCTLELLLAKYYKTGRLLCDGDATAIQYPTPENVKDHPCNFLFYRDMRRFHGVGQLKLATGFQYTGEFSSGQPHGHGEVLYPDCSTFRGPFEDGLRHGSGGLYICGVTGIRFSGEWIGDKVALQPSALSIETETRQESSCAEKDDDVIKRDSGLRAAGAREKKGHEKIKSSTKKQSVAEESPPEVQHETPLIAMYDSDGHVEPLWCRCVRQSQVRHF